MFARSLMVGIIAYKFKYPGCGCGYGIEHESVLGSKVAEDFDGSFLGEGA